MNNRSTIFALCGFAAVVCAVACLFYFQALPLLLVNSRLALNLNAGWRFYPGEPIPLPYSAAYDDRLWESVSLPHSLEYYEAEVRERAGGEPTRFPAAASNSVALAPDYRSRGRHVGWYRRRVVMPDEWVGRRVFLVFQGAMQTTRVWVNGQEAAAYNVRETTSPGLQFSSLTNRVEMGSPAYRTIGYEVSGYDSFHFDITGLMSAGTNVIAVKVNNLTNMRTPPDGKDRDYILFGGLYRDVFLVVTDPAHIPFAWEARDAGVRVRTRIPELEAPSSLCATARPSKALVDVETTVRNDGAADGSFALVTQLVDGEGRMVAVGRSPVDIAAGHSCTITQANLTVKAPRLWSPECPNLYRVESFVLRGTQQLDRVSTRFGIRSFRFDHQSGFVLNGKPLKLIGVNRHQTWPFIGNAVPNGLHRRDAEQIKETGFNFVRLSHYPQDPDFLDALDELGILALAEGPSWWDRGGEEWMDNLEKSFRSMIRRDRNHPCIFIWNTSINHNPAEPRLVQAAKEEDPDRPRGQDDVACLMSFKDGEIATNGALTIEFGGHKFPTSRGDRDPPSAPLGRGELPQVSANREYDQTRLHWQKVDLAYRSRDNAGVAAWCMYDYNTFHNSRDGIARHGLFDLFRLPKEAAWWYRSELTTEPMIHVVRVDATNACVFSNCERVRLLQDAGVGIQEVGTQAPDAGFELHHPPLHFAISSNAVLLKAEGLVGSRVRARVEWMRAGPPVALKLEADRPELLADGSDLSRLIVSAVDARGVDCGDCSLPIAFELRGAGRLIGENPAKLRAGKMVVLFQAGVAPATSSILATAGTLNPAQATVTSH